MLAGEYLILVNGIADIDPVPQEMRQAADIPGPSAFGIALGRGP